MYDWIAIGDRQPGQGERIAYGVRRGGRVVSQGVTTYDRFKWEHWAIAYWKPVLQHEEDHR